MRTGEIADAVGLHPNTIRLYEQWRMLPPVPRDQRGYRVFAQEHLDQVRLIRLAFRCTWIGGRIRRTAHDVIRCAAGGDFVEAFVRAKEHEALIQRERRRAEHAANVLKSWAKQQQEAQEVGFLRISEVARLLDVTPDMLRNWERNGFLQVLRHPDNGYRLYGRSEVNRLRVISLLRKARYGSMAILRMMRHLDQGGTPNVRKILDTPGPDEDALSASDRWLTALKEAESHANDLKLSIEIMLQCQT